MPEPRPVGRSLRGISRHPELRITSPLKYLGAASTRLGSALGWRMSALAVALSSFSRQSQSTSCFGNRGIASMRAVGVSLRTLEWKLKEMSREVPSPRETKSVYVLLSPVVRHAYSDRQGLLS